MTRHEHTDTDPADLVSRVRALIDRTSLGSEGPRRLRDRTTIDQLDRIRRLRNSDTDIGAGPSELAARRLIDEALGETRLPQRTPDPGRITAATGPSMVGRLDTATLYRVAAALRGSPSCTT